MLTDPISYSRRHLKHGKRRKRVSNLKPLYLYYEVNSQCLSWFRSFFMISSIEAPFTFLRKPMKMLYLDAIKTS